ncbi:MAG: phage virion morphogenesis protein [Moraxellaceae bacterium]|nr:phage virion morphogenesis protein [Moraxellaceae bacterium]
MAADLADLEAYAGGLIANLTGAERRALARKIAITLRGLEQRRIALQRNVDGSPYEPRKPRLRDKGGRIRRTMFAKLRTARYLKVEASESEAMVTFADQVQRIAQVHHVGLRERVSTKPYREISYPARDLLGFRDDYEASIADLVVLHLAQ